MDTAVIRWQEFTGKEAELAGDGRTFREDFGTNAFGINDSGQIVGFLFAAGNTTTHGFLDTGGTFTAINVAGATRTAAYGINDSGQIVGWFRDALGDHVFVDTGGSFTTIDAPGAIDIFEGAMCSASMLGSFAASPVACWRRRPQRDA